MLGNGATTVFSFPFVGVSGADIQVLYNNGTTITVLSPSSYTLTLNAAAAGQLWGIGGTVTYPTSGSPISNGTSLIIQRILPLTQGYDIQNQGNFYGMTIEQALDTLCMQLQQISARGGQIRGTWVTNTQYNYGDIVIDGSNGANTGNPYICATSNLSGVWATDLAAGDWSLQPTITGATGPQGPAGPAGTFQNANAGGTADAITATYSPALTLTNLTMAAFVASASNTTTTPTFSPNGLTAHTITKRGGAALAIGDIAGAGFVAMVEYNSANTRWELLNPAGPSIPYSVSVGGTGATSLTANGLLVGNGTGIVGTVSVADNAVITTNASGVPIPVPLGQGQIIIGATAGAPSAGNLTAGTNITITNADNGITISAPNSGGLSFLNTVVANNSAQVSFGSTYITSTYNAYKVVFDSVSLATISTSFELQVSADNGGTWKTTGYSWSTSNTVTNTSANFIDLLGGETANNQSNQKITGEIVFANPSATNICVFNFQTGFWDRTTGGTDRGLVRAVGTGAWATAGAINAIRFIASTGNISTGNFSIYGYAK